MPHSNQGKREQVARGCSWKRFEYLQGWRHLNLCRQPFPLFDHPHCKSGIFCTFTQCLVEQCSSFIGYHQEEAVFFTSWHKVFMHTDKMSALLSVPQSPQWHNAVFHLLSNPNISSTKMQDVLLLSYGQHFSGLSKLGSLMPVL